MKHLSYMLISLLSILFMNCSTSQINNETPFTIQLINLEENVLELELKYPLPEHIVLQNAYVGKEVSKWIPISDKSLTFKANFSNGQRNERLLILHSDPRQEFGNVPPVKNEKTLFKLTENECVISYTKNGKLKYFKTKFSLQN